MCVQFSLNNFLTDKTLTYEVYTEERAIGGDHLGTNVIAIQEDRVDLLVRLCTNLSSK